MDDAIGIKEAYKQREQEYKEQRNFNLAGKRKSKRKNIFDYTRIGKDGSLMSQEDAEINELISSSADDGNDVEKFEFSTKTAMRFLNSSVLFPAE